MNDLKPASKWFISHLNNSLKKRMNSQQSNRTTHVYLFSLLYIQNTAEFHYELHQTLIWTWCVWLYIDQRCRTWSIDTIAGVAVFITWALSSLRDSAASLSTYARDHWPTDSADYWPNAPFYSLRTHSHHIRSARHSLRSYRHYMWATS